MTAPLQWYQGESHKLTLKVYESDGVTAKPLTDYENLIIWIYNKQSGNVFAKYAMVALTGFDSANVVQVDIPGGELMVKIQQSVTLTAELGLHVIEIKEMLTDVDMDDNVLRLIGKKEFFIMNPAKSKMI